MSHCLCASCTRARTEREVAVLTPKGRAIADLLDLAETDSLSALSAAYDAGLADAIAERDAIGWTGLTLPTTKTKRSRS